MATKKKSRAKSASKVAKKNGKAGPVATIRQVCEEMGYKTAPKDVVARLLKMGLNESTIRTQVGHWRSEQKK